MRKATYSVDPVCSGNRIHATIELCPKCDAEPSYGPITVEMVAEMLAKSVMPTMAWCDWTESVKKSDFYPEARAVIRLLGFLNEYLPLLDDEPAQDYWHAKLMELAKEK
jgi:hypothetical protein